MTLLLTSLQRQRPLKRAPNFQNNLSTPASFLQRLTKKPRVFTKFDPYGVLMINSIFIVFHLQCCSKQKCFDNIYSECCAPSSSCHVHILIQNVQYLSLIVFFLSMETTYDWITNLGCWHIKMLYSTKINCRITPPPPHNGHLSTTATFLCPQVSRCGEVQMYYYYYYYCY